MLTFWICFAAPVPYVAAYAASKHAVQVINLHIELNIALFLLLVM